MSEINETTERIISELAKKAIPPGIKDFCKELGITQSVLINQLPILEIHEVAKYDPSPIKSTIKKMSKFGEVVKAGGLQKYIEAQKNYEFKNQAEKSELKDKLIKLQIEQLESQLEEKDRNEEISNLTIENLKINNKNIKMILILTIFGWIVTIFAENAQWIWSFIRQFISLASSQKFPYL